MKEFFLEMKAAPFRLLQERAGDNNAEIFKMHARWCIISHISALI
jgi:hypothetical protein